MITEEDARRIAREYLASELPDLDLVIVRTVEGQVGWGIIYNTKKFVETGDYGESMIGPGPLLVLREGGRVVMLGTGQSLENGMRDFAAEQRGKAPAEAMPVVDDETPVLEYGPPGEKCSRRSAAEELERAGVFIGDVALRDQHEGTSVSLVGWFLAQGAPGVATLAGTSFQFVVDDGCALVASLPDGFTPEPHTWYVVDGLLRSMGFEDLFAGIEIITAVAQWE